MGFIDQLFGRVSVPGSSSSSGAPASSAVPGGGDAFLTVKGIRIDPSFLDSLYAANKVTALQREGVLDGTCDPRTLVLSPYDLYYLTAGQYGSKAVNPSNPNNFVQEVLDAFTTAATEIAGASSETVCDKSLIIPAGKLVKVGDFVDVSFFATQNGRNSTDTTQLKVRLDNLSGATLFDSGALGLAVSTFAPVEGTITLVTVGSNGTAMCQFTTVGGATGGNNSFSIDTTSQRALVLTVTHSSSSGSNKTQLRWGRSILTRKL